MAKTTKAPAKRTTVKQNKKSKQVGIFGKSFDLKSRKVQFFVSIFIIAILGGGYFTFKSFAFKAYLKTTYGLSQLSPYELRNGTTASQATYPKLNTITELERNSNQKNNAGVIELPWRYGVTWTVSGSDIGTNKIALNKQQLRICALARKNGNQGTAKIELGGFAINKGASTHMGGSTTIIANGENYATYCGILQNFVYNAEKYQFWVFNRSEANGPAIRIITVGVTPE